MPEWQVRAACLGDLEFTERPHHLTAPICSGCPVRMECLEFGIAQAGSHHSTTVGYGGLTHEELTRLARARRRPPNVAQLSCAQCHAGFVGSRGRLYCSRTCRSRAYEARQPRSARKQMA